MALHVQRKVEFCASPSEFASPSYYLTAVTLLAGDLGTCIWNALVATHTFMTIVLRRSLPQALAVAFVVLAWAAVVLACE